MHRRNCLALAAGLPLAFTSRAQAPTLLRTIPSTGERIPGVGMGTWITFDIDPRDAGAMARRRQVLDRFYAGGGRLIDSSPMYGNAEAVVGELLGADRPRTFSATKVWTPLEIYGPVQMKRSLELWRVPRCDLQQVHNLLNWRAHLPRLREWKAEGRVRYIGVTTSHGSKHDEMRRVLEQERGLDFLQITYSPAERGAEPLMQLAADRGLAVIVNRPFDGGTLLERLAREPLPPVAAEVGCSHWAPLVLKWELAHPAVTCAIPATTQPAHMDQNMTALQGPPLEPGQRKALTAVFDRLLG